MSGPIDWDGLVLGPCMAIFGESSDPAADQRPLYTPAAGGAAFRIDAIFDDGYVARVLIDDGAPGFITSDPILGVRAAQFAVQPVQNDQVFVPRTGKTYLVNAAQPDGHGSIVLQLNEAAS